MAHPRQTRVLDELRERIARVERSGRAPRAALPFGVPAIDRHLPDGGLAGGSLHEVAPSGPEPTHAAAAGLFVGGILARAGGTVLWCLRSRDLFAPALSGVGLTPDRLLFVETHGEGDAGVLPVMEEGLRHRGLAGVVGEIARLSLAQARRLQLAAEDSGTLALTLRRWSAAGMTDPTAARTRWRLTALPSAPAPGAGRGVGRPRWRLELVRCRGGEPADFIMEACDAQGRLGVPADLADRPAPAQRSRRTAAG